MKKIKAGQTILKSKIMMLLSVLFLVISCSENQSNSHKQDQSDSIPEKAEDSENYMEPEIKYSEQELVSFMDSIGTHSPTAWIKEVNKIPDSVFSNRIQVNQKISDADFSKLKLASKTGKLDLKTAKRIFKVKKLDSLCFEGNNMLIEFLSFDQNKSDLNEFAIVAACYPSAWDSDVYFFKGNKLISMHTIYHRYGLELEHYKDENQQTVIYYKEHFENGTGVWWNNFFFYRYDQDRLTPILNEVSNSNLNNPIPKCHWIESFVVNTKPLKIKMVYHQELQNLENGETFSFINDSTTVSYAWNSEKKILEGNYKASKITREQIYSNYFNAKLQSDLLFIHAYYSNLKKALKDPKKRSAILYYLNEVKNSLND